MADIITRLKVESSEYDQKIKRAAASIQGMEQACRKAGGTFAVVEKEQLEFVKGLGRMETASKSARGRLGELTTAFTDLRSQYNRLTQEEKQSPFGKALNDSLNQLNARIKESKNELADINKELNGGGSKFGQFGSVIDTIGQKMGANVNITELLTSKTARLAAGMGALIGGVSLAASEWKKYNDELAKQQQVTTVTTGLKGDRADRMTDTIRALSDTYKVDFREAINAANTLMTQFGKTGDEAIQLIKDGMQGMIMGDGPKLLSMIQQFAPSFRDAGISADKLVAIIHNSEGGIFTDQNMNAIVMGIKNIRLMTNATSEALKKVGIDGQEMTKKLNDGSITIFEAMRQVSQAIENVGSGSQAAGEVMQQVFGRQGVAAGTNLGKAIATLNTNLEETKKQTGEVGEAFNELLEANEKLNKALREAFEYNGWEEMATSIKATLISALADVLEQIAKISKGWRALMRDIGLTKEPPPPVFDNYVGNSTLGYIREGKTKEERQKRYDQQISWLQKSYADADKPYSWTDNKGFHEATREKKEADMIRLASIRGIRTLQASRDELIEGKKVVTPPKEDKEPKTPKTKTPKADKKEELSISQQIGKLEQEAVKASEERRKEIAVAIQALDKELERQKAIKDELHGIKRETKEEAEARKELEAATKRLADAQAKLAEAEGTGSATAIFKARENVDKQQQALERVKNPSLPAPQQATGFAALTQTIETELKFDQMKVDETTLHSLLQTAIQNGINTLNPDFAALQEQIGRGIDVPESTWERLQTTINEKLKELGIDPIQIDFKTGNIKGIKKDSDNMTKSWQAAGNAIQQVGNAMSQIEDPATKVLGTIAQAIATIALGYAQATTQAAQLGPWAWIAFAATGMATMISSISAIKSATAGNFAKGGVVPGNSFTGDNMRGMTADGTVYGLDAGELILSRSQQNNLAGALQAPNVGNMRLSATLRGEDIRLALVNLDNRTGRGEIVRTR